MSGKKHILIRLLLIVLLGTLLAPLSARPAPEVTLTPLEGGGYTVASPRYKARIAPDGNLHSLNVNGVEFLDDAVAGSAGASYFVEQPIPLPTLTVADNTLTATDGTYEIHYIFVEGFISLTLRQTSGKGAAFVVVGAQRIAYVENLTRTGVAASAPADHDWSEVKLIMPTGEFLELRGGSRIWGRGIGRQAWERSNLAPKEEYSLTLIPGQGAPRQPGIEQLTALRVGLNNAELTAPAGKPVPVELRFENNAHEEITTEAGVRVESSRGTVLLDERKPLVCAAHQAAVLPWTVTPTEPDFYTLTATANLNGTLKRYTTTFGYDVAHIAPVAQRPVDFTDYWSKLTAQAKMTEVKLTRLEDRGRSTGTVTVYRLGLEAQGFTLFGWLAVPKFPGRYPGLLLLPGDRVRYISPNSSLAESGFVVMTIEPTGQEADRRLQPLITRATKNLADPATIGLRDITEHYLWAVTALSSVPEVDANRLAVTGVGMGGGLALILAALDDRIQAAAPDVPNFCHIELGRELPGWYPEIADYLQEHPEQQDAVLQTLRYFDVANFAEQITCPVLISAGINDTFCRPANIAAVANRIPGPCALKLYQAGHEGGGIQHWEVKLRWLLQVLGDASPVPPAPAKEDKPAEAPAGAVQP